MQAEAVRAAITARVLPEIPKLLTLLDRTPVSPTYGCFDRAYWHYRMMDFPCGMSQEFVLPLALVWSMELPGNTYFKDPALREWDIAGIGYAARSAHADGSCDDYYPLERASGAAAFSLFAILEALDIIEWQPTPEIDDFLQRRMRWLARHQESGRLSNHEALIVSCLERARLRFPASDFDTALKTRLDRLLSWQHEEGWFDEYGGADLGYLSLTIGLLADLDRRRPDLQLRPPLSKAIAFFAYFVHPDGTVGGEYSSRSTLNFFPFGFEIAGEFQPLALAINEQALRPLLENRTPCYSDDRIIAHHLWGWLFTLRAFRERGTNELPELPKGRRYFPGCGLFVDKFEDTMLVVALSRGGTYKFFANGRLAASDTGLTLKVKEGLAAVCHLGGSEVRTGGDTIESEGAMAWTKSARLTPVKNVVLRLMMIGFGRFFPDLIRKLLQKILVTGRSDAPFRYRRSFERTPAGWTVRDELRASNGWDGVEQIGISGHQTSITTIMARVYQEEQLRPFEDLTARLNGLREDEVFVFTRQLNGGADA